MRNEKATGSMEMAESESEEVCVALLQPEQTEAIFLISVVIMAPNISQGKMEQSLCKS